MSENQEQSLPKINPESLTYYGVANYRRDYNPYGRGPFIEGDTRIRDDHSRDTYLDYRSSEKVPSDPLSAISMGLEIYERVGLVYRAVNLMSDFVSAGIELHHKTPSAQRLYRKWFDRVNGEEVSERLINTVLKAGNVYGYREYSTVPVKTVSTMKAVAATPLPRPRRIPTSYFFMNPALIEPVGAQLSTFVKEPRYVLKLNTYLVSLITAMGNISPEERERVHNEIINDLPPEIKEAVQNNQQYILLPKEDMFHLHYKKNDWDAIAYPMTYSVFSTVHRLEKMHLADDAALDGALSNVRLWNVGWINEKNPAHSMLPDPEAMEALQKALSRSGPGGVIDILWGPELKFTESRSESYRFLSSDKYQQLMLELYEGLGIPPGLTGGGGSSNFNNNFVALQAMTKTLEYLRNILKRFWLQELKIVSDALNLTMPELRFEHINFSDDAVKNKLVLDMIDRDLISAEIALDTLNFLPEIEKKRILREQKVRIKSEWHKAGPYHNNQKDHDLHRIALQRGLVTPSELGLKLQPKKPGETTPLDLQKKQIDDAHKANQEANKSRFQQEHQNASPGGRPTGAKDKQKRAEKDTLSPATSNLFVKAIEAQDEIHNIVLPEALKHYGVANARQFTDEQKKDFESFKLNLFAKYNFKEEITPESVYKMISQDISTASFDNELVNQMQSFLQSEGRKPTVKEFQYIVATAKVNCENT